MIEIHTEISNINLSNGLKVSGLNFHYSAKRKEMVRVSGKPLSSTKSRNVLNQIPEDSRLLNQKLKSNIWLTISR